MRTCASFELLKQLHKFALTTKASTYHFYQALEKLTRNDGVAAPKSKYHSLFRMVTQWRHLQLLKWGGRAHDPAGVEATKPGQLAIRCPSCPYPGINLPEGWEEASAGERCVTWWLSAFLMLILTLRFLYMMFACMDANFRLKNQLVSNYSQDPGLGTGWAYMVARERYEDYVLGRANDEDVSFLFNRCHPIPQRQLDQHLCGFSSPCSSQHPIFSRSTLYRRWCFVGVPRWLEG